MLLDSNPYLLSAKDSLLLIRLLRYCDFSFIKAILPQSEVHILRRFPKIGRKVIEYSYVSGQCRQTIPNSVGSVEQLSLFVKGIYLSKALTCIKIFLYKQELLFCQGDGYFWPHCCMNNLNISHRSHYAPTYSF